MKITTWGPQKLYNGSSLSPHFSRKVFFFTIIMLFVLKSSKQDFVFGRTANVNDLESQLIELASFLSTLDLMPFAWSKTPDLISPAVKYRMVWQQPDPRRWVLNPVWLERKKSEWDRGGLNFDLGISNFHELLHSWISPLHRAAAVAGWQEKTEHFFSCF